MEDTSQHLWFDGFDSTVFFFRQMEFLLHEEIHIYYTKKSGQHLIVIHINQFPDCVKKYYKLTEKHANQNKTP